MKKTILTLTVILFSIIGFAQQQPKQDTTIIITLSLDQYRALLYTIDSNIDSKKVSKDLLDFISKSAAIKPKEIEAPKKTKP